MMIINKYIFRFSVVLSLTAVFLVIIFAYLFFERFITETETEITVTNLARFGNIEGKYLIFTPDEVFENTDSYYHDKTNADDLFKQFQVGKNYKVKVVGFYIPFIPAFRNIIEITDQNLPTKKLTRYK
jgi:hypothetical protein